MRTQVPWPTGKVLLIARKDGVIIDRREYTNTFQGKGADAIARNFAGDPAAPSLLISHIGLGCSYQPIVDAESTSGWSGTPVLDTAIFRQGFGSLKRTVGASTTVNMDHATLIPNFDIAALGTFPSAGLVYGFEFNFRVDLSARLDMASTEFRIYTGGTNGNGWKISLTNALASNIFGTALQDATWVRIIVPLSAMTAIGSPNQAQVRGGGMQIVTNSGGTAVINFDDFRATHISKTVDVSQATVVIPGEYIKKPVTYTSYVFSGNASGTIFLTDAEGVAQYDIAGLYVGAGAWLTAILPFSYYKANGVTLALTWTLSFQGAN